MTHQPSPWIGDFCYLLLTPVNGKPKTDYFTDFQSSYSREKSLFSPSLLSIYQNRYKTHSSLIPSTYGGILEIDYNKPEPGLVLSLPGTFELQKIDKHTITGCITSFDGSSRSEDPNLKMFFTLKMKHEIISSDLNKSAEKKHILIQFEPTKHQIIQMGFSFISQDQANLNLEREIKQSKNDYLESCNKQWLQHFDKIAVSDKDEKLLSTFDHNLYRCFLYPQRFYEFDANDCKIHYDTINRKVKPGPLYTNTGFWDTYKSIFPLFSLIAQKEYKDMLEGFLNSYRESGYLPRWLSPDERGSMPGTLIDAVIADAGVKSIGTELLPEFLVGMNKSASYDSGNERYGRQGAGDYLKYGYIPNTYHESVNHTLDYAYSDFCISKVAELVGDEQKVSQYRRQSLNYANLFDRDTGFMRAKDTDGNFSEEFNPNSWGKDYAEGSAWQSSFAVFHDFEGLIEKYSSPEAFLDKIIVSEK